MTLIIAQKLSNRIELLSDGALYDDAGIIHGAACKIDRVEGFPAVIAGSGKLDLLAQITGAMHQTFARLPAFDDAIHSLTAGVARLSRGRRVPPFRVILAGISETRGPEIYRFGSEDEGGMTPFVLHTVEYGAILQHNMCADMYNHLLAKGGLRVAGIAIMESARIDGIANGGAARKAPVVGCHVDFTTVSADGVSIERVHEWPDRIGETINLGNNVSPFTPMTRQQRRAIDRQNRKSA